MLDIIALLFLMIPIYALLLWIYFDPVNSLLFGQRWMFKEEPKVSDCYVQYSKIASLVCLIVITLSFVVAIVLQF